MRRTVAFLRSSMPYTVSPSTAHAAAAAAEAPPYL